MIPYADNIEILCTIALPELQAQNTVRVVELARELAEDWGIERAQGKIALEFEGLPLSPYWENPEVRAYVTRLDTETPWILYYLSSMHPTVRVYLRALLTDALFEVDVSEQTREDAMLFFKSRIYHIVTHCKEAGLDQRHSMVIQAVSYLFASATWIIDDAEVRALIASSCHE